MRCAVIAHHRGAILVVVVWCCRLADAIRLSFCQFVSLGARSTRSPHGRTATDDDDDTVLTTRNIFIAPTSRKTAQQNISPLPQSFPTLTLVLVLRSPGLAARCQSCPPQAQGPPAPLVRSIRSRSRSRWSLAPTLFSARTVGDDA
ncbi:uncharacterized protein J3D65DRAFT_159606 [Phyllosticta citribraziliensis]|uniref:Secreted protein n=1 Tax=Phyllosticta citribraziliensis TaxID=989973 RepID=A0ABR1L5Z0_9PEZI